MLALALWLVFPTHLSAHDPNAEPVVDMTIRQRQSARGVGHAPGNRPSRTPIFRRRTTACSRHKAWSSRSRSWDGASRTRWNFGRRTCSAAAGDSCGRRTGSPVGAHHARILQRRERFAVGEASHLPCGGTLIRTLVHYEPLTGATRTSTSPATTNACCSSLRPATW